MFKIACAIVFALLASCAGEKPDSRDVTGDLIYTQCRVGIIDCDIANNPGCSNVGWWDIDRSKWVEGSTCDYVEPIQ